MKTVRDTLQVMSCLGRNHYLPAGHFEELEGMYGVLGTEQR